MRELRNGVERMVILSERNELDVADLPQEIRAEVGAAPKVLDASASSHAAFAPVMPCPVSLDDWERRAIMEALAKSGGNKCKAAQLLGMSRSALYEKLKRYAIE